MAELYAATLLMGREEGKGSWGLGLCFFGQNQKFVNCEAARPESEGRETPREKNRNREKSSVDFLFVVDNSMENS